VELRHRQLIAATLPLVGPEAVLSHDSAAILHGLPVWVDSLHRVHITHRCRRSGGHRARHLHQHPGPLTDIEIVVLDGWPTTSLVRTVADLARTVALDRAVAFADAGLRLGLPRRQLDQEVERAGRRHGIGQLRFVAGFADGRAESPGESFSRLSIHQVGLPPPEPQYQVIDPMTGLVVARCDFGWEEHRTVGVRRPRQVRPAAQALAGAWGGGLLKRWLGRTRFETSAVRWCAGPTQIYSDRG
jgi:hypothetical protein